MIKIFGVDYDIDFSVSYARGKWTIKFHECGHVECAIITKNGALVQREVFNPPLEVVPGQILEITKELYRGPQDDTSG